MSTPRYAARHAMSGEDCGKNVTKEHLGRVLYSLSTLVETLVNVIVCKKRLGLQQQTEKLEIDRQPSSDTKMRSS